ncbi:hypothetical protein EVAR_32028_1 [Eumeta japonica]|uniref:DUF4817 domain-containing protein n=1 Tax=Eumeta variegata TaxID=151549 RepID=A0A4C1WPM4_EUMVA|nr:hypothetical protein EVAR_32028_1 [Eumeta japonica]
MHLIYGECRCNASAAARLYRERYPNVIHDKDHRVFTNVHCLLSEGRFPNPAYGEGRIFFTYQNVVLKAVEDPALVRAIEASTGGAKVQSTESCKKPSPIHIMYSRIEYNVYYTEFIFQNLGFDKR